MAIIWEKNMNLNKIRPPLTLVYAQTNLKKKNIKFFKIWFLLILIHFRVKETNLIFSFYFSLTEIIYGEVNSKQTQGSY